MSTKKIYISLLTIFSTVVIITTSFATTGESDIVTGDNYGAVVPDPGGASPNGSAEPECGSSSFTYKTLVKIPGIGEEITGENGEVSNVVTICPNSLATYLKSIFNYVIGIALALTVVMVIYGGAIYATTDAAGKKSEGKKIIQDSFYGLALALSAWLILYTINPELTKLDLSIERLEETELTRGGEASEIILSRGGGNVGLGTGGVQNGQNFTRESNRLIVRCPSPLTTHQGKRICPELLQKLQSAASRAGVSITITQTFNPSGGSTPSSSSCHTPGGASPYAGSCADVAVNGAGRHSQNWSAFCQAVGTTPGLFTNNEASNLSGCTQYVGSDNFKPGVSTGPHLHILYTGGSGGDASNGGGDGSFGGDPRGAHLDGTFDNPRTSAGVDAMTRQLAAGKKITRIVVTGTGGSNGTIAFYIDNKNSAEVTIPIKVGANGMSEPGRGVEGDKKTPKGSYTLGSGSSRMDGPQRTAIMTRGRSPEDVSMGLGVFNIMPSRSIHLHGTRNDPSEPTSGCVRMKNDDIVAIGKYFTRGIPVQIR